MLDNEHWLGREEAEERQKAKGKSDLEGLEEVKPRSVQWNPGVYGEAVARVLALAGNGERLMPLAEGSCCSEEAREILRGGEAEKLFPSARSPRGVLSGLYLYMSCRDEAHEVAQEDSSVEGSYWHGIVHRQEPDAANAAYWFRRVGAHAIFPGLLESAQEIAASEALAAVQFKNVWDPLAFVDICETARRRPGSELERAALAIQRAEWQLLFDHCARGISR